MSRPTKITLHRSALKHNLQQVRNMAPNCSVLAMVKSNAYGHGIERVSQALPEVDAFGVACIEEGMRLREAGVTKPIVLMEGLFNVAELDKANQNDFTLVIHHEEQLKFLEKNPVKNPFSVWLKINTGMYRLGFAPQHFQSAYTRLEACRNIKKPIGLMTHLAESDSPERAPTLQQIDQFNSLTQHLAGPRSIANSGGIIAWPSAHADWVRPGIMLYGASPFSGHRGVEHHLQPVMALSSQLIAIHDVKKNARIGYGGTWTCPEDMRLGVVAIGYGDGYPRHARNGTPILVNNRPCPLVGRVSMDMLTVDLRTQPEAKLNDEVLLWGPGLPVEVVAEFSDTSAYELLTRITQRVHVEIK